MIGTFKFVVQMLDPESCWRAFWPYTWEFCITLCPVFCFLHFSFCLFVYFQSIVFINVQLSNGNYMMVCDWSEIGLTTVRDVTDSFHRVLYLRYFL